MGDKAVEADNSKDKRELKPLTKEEIAKKVEELTKNSPFNKRKAEKKEALDKRVAAMKRRIASASTADKEKARLMTLRLTAEAEEHRNLSKVMVHVDMDAFYASVEIRDQPELATKPVAIGGNSMLSTCNYEARRWGCRSAMPGFVAKKLCPHLVLIAPNFDKYRLVSRQARQIYAQYCPGFTTMGLDEAYLDITDYLEKRLLGQVDNKISNFKIPESLTSRVGCCCEENSYSEPSLYCGKCRLLKCKVGDEISFNDSAWNVVEEIRFKILIETNLTSSAGIAPNTMIAKIASDLHKPNGQYMVRSDAVTIRRVMESMEVAKVPFIGPVQQGELKGLGITTCGDLRNRLEDLYLIFGEERFDFFLRSSLGLGATELEHGGPRKSLGTETTFDKTSDMKKLLEIIKELCEEVADSLEDEQLCGKTVTLKIKTAEFRNYTRAGSCPSKGLNPYFMPSQKGKDMFQVAKGLLEKEVAENQGKLWIRLLGVRISNLKELSEVQDEASKGSVSSLFNEKKSAKKRPLVEKSEEVVVIDDNENSSLTEPNESGSSLYQSFDCPICNSNFPKISLLKFNQHIDECLNRGALQSMKHEQHALSQLSTLGQNRKSISPPAVKQTKRSSAKSGRGQSSILTFLKPR